jgi:hypothetical protein
MAASSESEVLAQELSNVSSRIAALETRMTEVQAVIERLEAAAEIMARALEEVSSHWDACTALCAAQSRTGPNSADATGVIIDQKDPFLGAKVVTRIKELRQSGTCALPLLRELVRVRQLVTGAPGLRGLSSGGQGALAVCLNTFGRLDLAGRPSWPSGRGAMLPQIGGVGWSRAAARSEAQCFPPPVEAGGWLLPWCRPPAPRQQSQ